MSRIKLSKAPSLFLLSAYSISSEACSKHDEPVPFFDGLHLKYKVKGARMLGFSNSRRIYEVRADHEHFNVTNYVEGDQEDVREIIVDRSGRIKRKTSFGSIFSSLGPNASDAKNRAKGTFSSLWLPTHVLKIGDRISDSRIVREEKWRKWEVMVLREPTFRSEMYYHKESGYWVGMKGRAFGTRVQMVLVETNADIVVDPEF